MRDVRDFTSEELVEKRLVLVNKLVVLLIFKTGVYKLSVLVLLFLIFLSTPLFEHKEKKTNHSFINQSVKTSISNDPQSKICLVIKANDQIS